MAFRLVHGKGFGQAFYGVLPFLMAIIAPVGLLYSRDCSVVAEDLLTACPQLRHL